MPVDVRFGVSLSQDPGTMVNGSDATIGGWWRLMSRCDAGRSSGRDGTEVTTIVGRGPFLFSQGSESSSATSEGETGVSSAHTGSLNPTLWCHRLAHIDQYILSGPREGKDPPELSTITTCGPVLMCG